MTSWWSIAEPADNTAFELDILWTFFFSMPMFLISKILSNFFFQDIADAGYSHTREGHRTRKKDGGAFRDLADMVYDSVLLLMLGIQVSVRFHRVPAHPTAHAPVTTSIHSNVVKAPCGFGTLCPCASVCDTHRASGVGIVLMHARSERVAPATPFGVF